MKPRELLRKLFAILPGFEACWNSADNNFVDETGRCTLHGVCAQLSRYVEDNYQTLASAEWKELFDEIEFHIRGSEGPEAELDNALCTCFLENISSTPAGEAAKAWMGPKSRRFFDAWHEGMH